ncbi:MAG: sugar phosphate isomerase/epimerase [Pedosphaera sp.]|nr:sugar phosphate isomerase/epimerase [Pedosphaera sp.]MSU43372.1 sugar phosphate isomerase/epimerase [Pedosphaera sp.]
MRSRRQFVTLLAAAGAGFSARAAPPAARSTMGMVIAGFHLRSRLGRAPERPAGVPAWNGPLDFLEHSHALGAGGIQTNVAGWEQEGLARRLRARGEALGMFLEGQIRLPADDAGTAVFAKQLDAAKEAGVTVLRAALLDGRRYETFQTVAAWKAFNERALKSLALAEPLARQRGLKLAVENHKDWLAGELADILRKISSLHIGATLDTGNNIALLEDPMATLEALVPFALSTHLKDMAVEECDAGFRLSEVPLGRGLLDLPRIIAVCKKANPTVRFNLEMITREPLVVPCLQPQYWTTLGGVPGERLAAMLRWVRANRPKHALPSLAGKSPAQQVAFEEANNRDSIQHARQQLGL